MFAIFRTVLAPAKTSYVHLAKNSLMVTLAARGLEERRDFEESLTESVGHVHFS